MSAPTIANSWLHPQRESVVSTLVVWLAIIGLGVVIVVAGLIGEDQRCHRLPPAERAQQCQIGGGK